MRVRRTARPPVPHPRRGSLGIPRVPRWRRAVALVGGLAAAGLLPPVVPRADATETVRGSHAVPRVSPAPGEPELCLAKVAVPERWITEPLEIERREASMRFEITPARFGPRERRVVVREAASTLRAVQPVLTTETRTIPQEPATTRWVRAGPDGDRPIAVGDRLDLLAAGIEPDAVAPGTCYAEHFRPPRFRTTSERVLVREATEHLTVTDATFETVTRSIITRPAHSWLIEVPTVWETGERRVEVRSASVDWEPGAGDVERRDPVTGETVHRVDRPVAAESRTHARVATRATVTRVREPALRESVEVRRLVGDAVGTREPVPAVWRDVDIPHVEAPGAYVWQVERSSADDAEPPVAAARPTLAPDVDDRPTGRRLCRRDVAATAFEYEREVVREEGRFERETRPAEHVVLGVQALLADARSERVEVPAVVETAERRVQVRPAGTEWRPVLCEARITHPVVARLQRALEREGFSPGPIDGDFGSGTRAAVTRYQRANGLASGALTIETVDALGVEP